MDNMKRNIKILWATGGKKPMLVGRAGCGKTAMVNGLGEELGVKVKAINTASFEGIDANGLPYIKDGTLEISKPFWLEGLVDGDILFLDEFSNAPTDVRNAFLQIILDGKLPSGLDMPDLRVIGAMNTSVDLENYAEFSGAMKDRWAFIPFDIPKQEWIEMLKVGFKGTPTPEETEVRSELVEFLTTNMNMIENHKPIVASNFGITDEVETLCVEYATPNRRNWNNLAIALAKLDGEKLANDEHHQAKKSLFIQFVGIVAWRTYGKWLTSKGKPLSTYKWNGDIDELAQQMNILFAEPDSAKQLKYFLRGIEYNREFVITGLTTVMTANFNANGGKIAPELLELESEINGKKK